MQTSPTHPSDIYPTEAVNMGAATTVHSETGSYVDWAAILAGAIFAAALSFILLSFGGAVGLSMASPYRGEGVSATWATIAAGIWFIWVMISSFGAGGYLAGRMRRRAGDATADEVEARDGAHGLMVWATGSLVATMLAFGGLGGALGGAALIGGSAAGKAAEVASEADLGYYADLLIRGGATEAGGPIDDATRAEIAGIVGRSLTTGEIVERDKAYLATLVAEASGLDEAAARARVDEVVAEIDEARAAALAAVERARVAGVIFGFIAAATLIASAAAAYFSATGGGGHRDQGLGFAAFSGARR